MHVSENNDCHVRTYFKFSQLKMELKFNCQIKDKYVEIPLPYYL